MTSAGQFLFNRFKKNETALHELSYLFWECTKRCNLNCLHCGSDCGVDSAIPEMPFEDFLNAILPLKKAYKPDSITVAIMGGEPLLRKDLGECGRTLRQHGFRWGIVTNGYGYTPEIHGALLGAGMGSLTLSLDGLEANHNWLRNNAQSFSRALAALGLITASERLNYDIVTCVNRRNIDELEQLRNFLIERNVKAWRLFTISPIGRASHQDTAPHDTPDYNELLLEAAQVQQLMDFIAAARKDTRMQVNFSCESYLGNYELKARDAYFFCRAGIQIASILADGSISACPNINHCFIQGNIYQDDFLDVWNNRFSVMRDRRWTKTGACLGCKAYKNCLGGAMHLWNEKQDGIMTCLYQSLK